MIKGAPDPVHLVVPDQTTADVLVSIADNLAGHRAQPFAVGARQAEGRHTLTFDGQPAQDPTCKLSREGQRTGVSFLLEEDRARALILRSPIVDVRSVLAKHLVAGGPAVASGRLDYLFEVGTGNREGTARPPRPRRQN